MSSVSLTVNGATLTADVAPRVHLADFLRGHCLLTGTHLGCEHGVCGACTLLIDGQPARSCIAFAAACAGKDIRTIEGLEDDPVMVRLRAAFTAEHALQCGYCTPGMLVTARDIVLRLPDADEARIRLELAGNLCRCTGYGGIVRAIRSVLADPPERASPLARPVPVSSFATATVEDVPAAAQAMPADAPELALSMRVAALPEAVWQALQDPRLVAECVPGAQLISVEGNRIEGALATSFGPIQARFIGAATVGYEADRRGWLRGEGRDSGSGTRMSGEARFAVRADGAGSLVDLAISYALRGPLAQFSRGALVRAFAAEIVDTVGRNLAARLSGRAVAPVKTLGMFGLVWRVVLRWFGR